MYQCKPEVAHSRLIGGQFWEYEEKNAETLSFWYNPLKSQMFNFEAQGQKLPMPF
jgi:hypothetical protein